MKRKSPLRPALYEGRTAMELWQAAFNDTANWPHQDSRAGPVLEQLRACLFLLDPRERWVVNRFPPINPAFAVAEVLWILEGSNRADFLTYWNSSLPKYVGSAPELYGAYGERLRSRFGLDQLMAAAEALSENDDSRQVVLQIWDPRTDLPLVRGLPRAEDIPCNLCSMLKVRDGRLEWTQIMRSNDLYRGLPYNLIQFTTLQEILAGWIKVPMGTYAHFTDSLHLYEADRLASSISGTAPNNTDSLAVSEHDLQDILVGGKQLIDTVRCASTEKELYSALPIGVPVGWRNLFLVLMVEVARKKKMGDVQQALLEACTNPVLSTAIVNWNNHLNSKKTRAFQVRQEASVI